MTSDHLTGLPWNDASRPLTFPEEIDGYSVAEAGRFNSKKLIFTGKCPFCRGDMEAVYEMKLIPPADTALTGQGGAGFPAPISCRCDANHPATPLGHFGCGGSWVMSMEKR